jgi:hypothetical protein
VSTQSRSSPSELPSEFRAAGKVVRFSPAGVELTDRRGRTTRLEWSSVSAVEPVRVLVRSRLGLVGTDEHEQRVAIPLGAIDPYWTHGAMGAWVRVFRPDLL